MADNSEVGVRFRQEQVVREVLDAWAVESRDAFGRRGLTDEGARFRAAGRVVDALAGLGRGT